MLQISNAKARHLLSADIVAGWKGLQQACCQSLQALLADVDNSSAISGIEQTADLGDDFDAAASSTIHDICLKAFTFSSRPTCLFSALSAVSCLMSHSSNLKTEVYRPCKQMTCGTLAFQVSSLRWWIQLKHTTARHVAAESSWPKTPDRDASCLMSRGRCAGLSSDY